MDQKARDIIGMMASMLPSSPKKRTMVLVYKNLQNWVTLDKGKCR